MTMEQQIKMQEKNSKRLLNKSQLLLILQVQPHKQLKFSAKRPGLI